MRQIGIVTGARSDFSILLPVLRKTYRHPKLKLLLYVTGMHLAPEFGMTVRIIENEGLPIAERIVSLLASDQPEGIAKSMGAGIAGFAQSFARLRPDLLVALGDRFEIFAAVAAALPFNIPTVHLSGGEVTEGVIDESFRHAITKMSHFHLVATELSRQRILQMGEEDWRIRVVGEPSLDLIPSMKFLSPAELQKLLGIRLQPSPLIVTFHPETIGYQKTATQITELLCALESCRRPIVFTASNADTGSRAIQIAMKQFVAGHPSSTLVASLGYQAYFSLMKIGACMVGNSSSGIVEAASFKLPVVNVGNRQAGRTHAANVIHANCDRRSIARAIRRATSPGFKATLRRLRNPYGDGKAADRIVKILAEMKIGERLLRKKFCDLEVR